MDDRLKTLFEGWIDAHFDEMVEEIKNIVRIPSVSRYDEPGAPYGRECLRALRHYIALAGRFGLDARSVDDRCAEAGALTDDENAIALWCHLDVVPVDDTWKYTRPFEPIILGDYLIGRGGDDNKGPAIACLYLLRMFKELGVKTRHPLRACVGTDEEKHMGDVKHYALTRPAAKLNIVADSGFPVCFAEKGIIEADIAAKQPVSLLKGFSAGTASNIVPAKAEAVIDIAEGLEGGERVSMSSDGARTRVTASGIPAHSANPSAGLNAIKLLTEKLLALKGLTESDRRTLEFFDAVNDGCSGDALGIASSDEVSGNTTCAGTMARMTDDGRPVLHVNIRACVSADCNALAESMKQKCLENGCEIIALDINEGNFFPPEKPVVNELTKLFNELSGLDKKPYAMGGGTYARKLPNAIAYGLGGLVKPETDLFEPGHGGAHQADEALYLPNLKKAMLILALSVLKADEVTQ